jgi:hypothetical protein
VVAHGTLAEGRCGMAGPKEWHAMSAPLSPGRLPFASGSLTDRQSDRLSCQDTEFAPGSECVGAQTDRQTFVSDTDSAPGSECVGPQLRRGSWDGRADRRTHARLRLPRWSVPQHSCARRGDEWLPRQPSSGVSPPPPDGQTCQPWEATWRRSGAVSAAGPSGTCCRGLHRVARVAQGCGARAWGW